MKTLAINNEQEQLVEDSEKENNNNNFVPTITNVYRQILKEANIKADVSETARQTENKCL